MIPNAFNDIGYWITIDSGQNTGWSWWHNRQLLAASSCPIEEFRKMLWPYSVSLAIYELPAYRSKGKIENITLCSALGGIAAQSTGAKEVEPLLTTWKGSVPKNIMIERIRSLLIPEELALIRKKSSHCFDAIGMGLKLTGRLL